MLTGAALRRRLLRPPIWKTSTVRHSTPALRSHFSTFRQQRKHLRTKFQSWGFGTCTLLAATVPVALAHNKGEADGDEVTKTIEQQMLELSEKERLAHRRGIPSDISLPRKIVRAVKVFVVNYIHEPLATGMRFVTLVFIFAPIILTIPVVYFGSRIPNESDERAGTVWWYGFLVRSLERAGPTFIKLGQWAASRTDIFPTELCEKMSKLHSNAKAHSMHATKRIICHAFGGRKFEDIFEEFDEKTLGVGAIAQVYKAKLKPDLVPPVEFQRKDFRRSFRETVDGLVKRGPAQAVPSSYVAIKVIHPNVDKIVNRDLRIMRFFAVILNAIPTLEWLSFPDEVDTFSDMMRLQMDLRIEAENLAKFRSNFKNRSTVSFPMPYRDYTTRDVLIEEFAHGIPLADFLDSGAGVFREALAGMGLDAFLHMLVMDNFIHSDLHPGNIMVRFLKPSDPLPLLSRLPFLTAAPTATTGLHTDDVDATQEVRSRLYHHRHDIPTWEAELEALDAEGYRPQLVFIDAGLVTELNSKNRRNFLDLFRAVAEFDGYRAGQLMIERSRSPNLVLDTETFALKLQHLVLTVKSRTLALGNISFGDILSDVLGMVRKHHVRMEGDFVNVILSMLLVEGIGRSLYPDVDLLKSALPMLRAVGAGTGRSVLSKGGHEGMNGTLSLLKVWVALETRTFVTTSIQDIENLVKYDMLSPNI